MRLSSFPSRAFFFGFYYYNNKNNIERNRKKCERYNKFYDTILDKIDMISSTTNKILTKDYNDSTDLKRIVANLNHDLDTLETLVETANQTYHWDRNDFIDILKFRSFISKKVIDTLSISPLTVITDEDALALNESHRVLIDKARRACFSKIEEIYYTY